MKVSAEKIENQQVVLTIEVDSAELDKAEDRACTRLAGQVKIPGFRKGKAPRRIVETHVGKDAVLQEAFDLLAPKGIEDALKDQSIDAIVSRPQVDIVTLEDGKDLVFKATVVPRPAVTLGEYKGLKIEKSIEEVTDEAVQQQLDHMADHQSKMVDAPEGAAVEKGDFTTLDYKGEIDGVAFAGGEGKDYPLEIGSGSFIPGFEDQLIGVHAGEEKDVNVTFPQEYHAKDLAGKAAVFHCKVNSIKRKELPEINDDFAKATSKFDTLEALKADIRENLQKNNERKAADAQKEQALETATNNTTVDIPPVMIDNEVERMIREMQMRLAQQGMQLEQYLQFAGTDIAKLRETYRETAEKNVRTGLMLEEVAKAENITAGKEDIDKEVEIMAAAYGATPKQVKKIIREQGRQDDLKNSVVRNKTMQFIFDNIAE